MRLRVQGPTYFSPNDEIAMFEWLGRIGIVEEVTGEGPDLVLHIRSSPSDGQIRDLLALFFRYQMDMTGLAALRTPRNETWFAEPGGFWFSSVFGHT